MRLIATAFTAAVLVVASAPAVAADRISDSAYLQAARCQGLAHASQLGAFDASRIDALMEAQSGRRDSVILDRAENVAKDARRAARSADARARLVAERDRVCAAFGATTQSAGSAAGASAAQ